MEYTSEANSSNISNGSNGSDGNGDSSSGSSSSSSSNSSSGRTTNTGIEYEKDSILTYEQEPHSISYIPQNQIQPNHKQQRSNMVPHSHQDFKAIQNRLNNIYYNRDITNTTAAITNPMSNKLNNTTYSNSNNNNNSMTALTRQHLDRACQLSSHAASATTKTITTSTASLLAASKEIVLEYNIHNHSSHSGSYHPQHICVNKPNQQASRWSSGLHDHEQFITIKFDTPVVARTILFGKFHKGHVCNLKEFKVFGGMDPEDEMTELLHSGLKNDTEPESFSLKHQQKNMVFPVKYIKIVPLSAFGANFNYSIWYVQVRGINQDALLARVCSEYENFKEVETTRLCLKYFRQKNMMDVFYMLKERTGVELEHPLISELHRHLVVDANFAAAEHVLQQAHKRNIYKPYSDAAKYTPIWRQIHAKSKDGDSPTARGGHQMCIDVEEGMIYILGGWDGQQDLSDFWSFDTKKNIWKLLSADTQLQGGPSPRSCHKICFDPASKSIFVLGRYVESQLAPVAAALESDFYRYYIEFDQWIKLNDHTAREGGPELIFDHQMCADPEGEMLYVFGGRTISSASNIQNYSGLYSYNIKDNRWRLIRNDDIKTDSILPLNNSSVPLKSRVGHSMVFDQTKRSLYVFAGQRVKDYLSDLYRYSVDEDCVTEIVQDYNKEAGPDTGFTQRATMDESLQEIYVLSGYMRNPGSDVVRNALWVYSITKNEWQKVYQNENKDVQYWCGGMEQGEPCPRFAHQMVYDTSRKIQYIFGGNPGHSKNLGKRLDDFWELKLTKPDPSAILRKSFYMIRMQRLRELCSRAYEQRDEDEDVSSETLIALEYLRREVAPVVDHEDEAELEEFHQMCASLCLLETMTDGDKQTKDTIMTDILKTKDTLYTERTRLFEKLLEYIPHEMKEPLGKLTSAAKLV